MKIPDLKTVIFGTQKKAANRDSTEGFVPVKNISDGIIQLDNGKYVTVLEVLPLNFYLKSELEQKNIISGFAAWLKIAPSKLQISVQTRPADIDAFCERLEGCYNAESNESCRRMIFEDAQLVNDIAENQAVTRRFYIVLPYEGSSTELSVISDEMSDTLNTARQYLEACGLETVTHTDEDLFLYGLLCGFLRPSRNGVKPTKIPGDIKDALSPDSVDMTHRDYTVIENEYRSCLYLSAGGYPSAAGLAWAAPFAEAGGGITAAVFYLEKMNREQIIHKIGNAAVFNRSRLKDIGDTRSDYEQLDDAIESALFMKSQINREGEDFYYIHTLISVSADNAEDLKRREKETVNLCSSLGFTARRSDYMQDKAFLSLLPLLALDRDIAYQSRRNILTSGAAAAFPFSSFEMCDETGIFYGLIPVFRRMKSTFWTGRYLTVIKALESQRITAVLQMKTGK